MTEKNISLEFGSKDIDEIRNYFIKEVKQNEFISKKHKKVCKNLNYSEHLLISQLLVAFQFLLLLLSCGYCKFCSRNKNLCYNCSN